MNFCTFMEFTCKTLILFTFFSHFNFRFFNEETKSPVKKATASSSGAASKTSKKLILSPKNAGKLLKSPVNTNRSKETSGDNSIAVNTAKKLKNLIESDTDGESINLPSMAQQPTKRKTAPRKPTKMPVKNPIMKSINEPVPSTSVLTVVFDVENKTVEMVEKPTEDPKSPPIQEELPAQENPSVSEESVKSMSDKPASQSWTRDEDKFILEEQRKGFETVSELMLRLMTGLSNRSVEEITTRYEFLMDLLRKIENRTT